MKSSLADAVEIPFTSLRAGAFSIKSEQSEMAKVAPEHDTLKF